MLQYVCVCGEGEYGQKEREISAFSFCGLLFKDDSNQTAGCYAGGILVSAMEPKWARRATKRPYLKKRRHDSIWENSGHEQAV
jgi:hypothetical protein